VSPVVSGAQTGNPMPARSEYPAPRPDVSIGVNTVKRRSDSGYHGLESVIESCQRQAAPHRQFPAGGIRDERSKDKQCMAGPVSDAAFHSWHNSNIHAKEAASSLDQGPERRGLRCMSWLL
jgi:hypothetical protein